MTTTNSHEICQLDPQDVWGYFYQLTQIPRPSHHEDAIQQFMLDFGQGLGLETFRDAVGNVIIKKPATQGMADRKAVILQSHLDMVPQANKDSRHNFATDPLSVYIDNVTGEDGKSEQWVTADGTTLGADNGLGVAAMMAILASDDIAHPALEALFTSTEETGMDGAFGLEAGVLEGEILLNLDSEDAGELYVGCAGGVDVTANLPITRGDLPSGMQAYHLKLTGLRGGHSGLNIIDQRANANKLLVRWLIQMQAVLGDNWRLIALNGGNLRNAIPREAEAVIAFDPAHLMGVKKHIKDYLLTVAEEYQGIENVKQPMQLSLAAILPSNGEVTVNDGSDTDADADANSDSESNADSENTDSHDPIAQQLAQQPPLTPASTRTLLNLVNASPNGVHRMSVSMADLVETSVNMGIIEMQDDSVSISHLIRSSLESAKDELVKQLASLYALAGVAICLEGDYPGWSPNLNSQILQVMTDTGTAQFGQPPELKAIHAGLECGILARNYPHWDMISFGPTITGAHSPDERVKVDTVAPFYEWLKATLASIPHKQQ